MRISDWSSDVCSSDLLVGTRLELAGPPVPTHRGRAERVEQDGLADTAQSGQDQGTLRTPPGHALEHDVEGGELLVATGELGRPLAGAGRVGVPDRVHDWRLSGCLAKSVDIPSESYQEAPDKSPAAARSWARCPAARAYAVSNPLRSASLNSGTSSTASRNDPAHTFSRPSESTTRPASWCPERRLARPPPRW